VDEVELCLAVVVSYGFVSDHVEVEVFACLVVFYSPAAGNRSLVVVANGRLRGTVGHIGRFCLEAGFEVEHTDLAHSHYIGMGLDTAALDSIPAGRSQNQDICRGHFAILVAAGRNWHTDRTVGVGVPASGEVVDHNDLEGHGEGRIVAVLRVEAAAIVVRGRS
jgi:hypothetical protein